MRNLLPIFLFIGVGLVFSPVSLAQDQSCLSCHDINLSDWASTPHAVAGLTCQTCHPNPHDGSSPVAESLYQNEVCAPCHQKEIAGWQLSPHHVPLPYTYAEIGDARIQECAKCHNTRGYIQVLRSGQDFNTTWAQMPSSEPAGITCSTCHDPHSASHAAQLRLPKAELCSSCHGIKWQNLMLTGQSHDEYSTEDYTKVRPTNHNSKDRCVMCHMAPAASPGVGGHTLLMESAKGKLNTAACVPCHGDVVDYNINGQQTAVQSWLDHLESYLKEQNGGELPGFQPGNCNQCHRGGTLPFKNDPTGKLDKAYQVYLFVKNDASLGVHNSDYALKLLQDAYRYAGGTMPMEVSRPDSSIEDDICLSCKWGGRS